MIRAGDVRRLHALPADTLTKRFESGAALPISPTGKIQKAKLREQLRSRSPRRVGASITGITP